MLPCRQLPDVMKSRADVEMNSSGNVDYLFVARSEPPPVTALRHCRTLNRIEFAPSHGCPQARVFDKKSVKMQAVFAGREVSYRQAKRLAKQSFNLGGYFRTEETESQRKHHRCCFTQAPAPS